MQEQNATPEAEVSGTVSESGHDYGPLQTFEITWMSGHVEKVQGHQLTSDRDLSFTFGNGDLNRPRFLYVHGCIDKKWTSVLQARIEDIRIVRNVTSGEILPGGESL